VGGGFADSVPTVTPTGASTIVDERVPEPEPYRPPLPANLPAAGMPVLETPADPYLGQVIASRYHITRKLGEGGMGAVYLATHVTLEKEVAIKILHGALARKPDLVERFLQEAKAASRIRHENVIDITDFGSTQDGAVFFAMEVLEGYDLHDLITRARYEKCALPWPRIRAIFVQICSALSAAHARGVIHRDLKPENIYLIERMGNPDFVKLLDFGIAKLTEVSDNERKLTKTGMLFGTPEYMSPEQARGDKVDHRVDVYAMGCILYQLIIGRVPFEADNFMGVLSRHLSDPIPFIAEQRLHECGAPADINSVIQRALAKNRDERHASMDELLQDLERVESAGVGVGVGIRPAIEPGTGPLPVAHPRPDTPAPFQPRPPTQSNSAEPAPASRQRPATNAKSRSSAPWLALVVILIGSGVGAGVALYQANGPESSGESVPDTESANPDLENLGSHTPVTGLNLDAGPAAGAVVDMVIDAAVDTVNGAENDAAADMDNDAAVDTDYDATRLDKKPDRGKKSARDKRRNDKRRDDKQPDDDATGDPTLKDPFGRKKSP
jgi:serine/threonine protein kinase